MREVDLYRNSHLIDPSLHFWGWEVPVYLFLGGLTAGMMVMGACLLLRSQGAGLSRWARFLPFVSPLVLSLGMLALFVDLEYKVHVLRFYVAFMPLSPMSWGSWILLAVYPATLALGFATLRDDEAERLASWGPLKSLGLGATVRWLRRFAASRAEKIAWTSIALGIALGTYTGILIGTLAARAAWNSMVFGPLFLVSGISTGAALMMLFPLNAGEHQLLRRWDLVAIGVELVLLPLFFLGLASGGGAAGWEAIAMFFGGAYTAPFWTLVVLGGLLVPFGLELFETIKGIRPTLMAPALVLVGGLALRFIIVAAGQA